MIVNCAYTCSETHTLYMPVLMHYTNQLTAEQETWSYSNKLRGVVDYITRNWTETERANSRSCHKIEALSKLVVMCVDPQPPD